MKILSLDQALDHAASQTVPPPEETKLSILWEKVRPFIVTISTIFGKKVRPYIKAFIAAIDEIVAKEESDI